MICLSKGTVRSFVLCWFWLAAISMIRSVIALPSSARGIPAMQMSSYSSTKCIVRIAEPIWRQAASRHSNRIRELLRPGLTPPDHVLNSGIHRQSRSRRPQAGCTTDQWTALDPKHPVYNFLIEYYGLKGAKGPKRLARWSPNPNLVYFPEERITTSLDKINLILGRNHDGIEDRSHGGVLLEGATEDDVGTILHLRGATPTREGIFYSAATFYNRQMSNDETRMTSSDAAPYLWYRSILQQTLTADPVLHCHGLHEMALQYRPSGHAPPPSAKYQSHLPLRVSQETINAAVERRGISCTHVDALRYFAPAAGPLNHHGASLQRVDQLRLEQPACVHAHMDLLKITLKLQPFVDPHLLERVLEIALLARMLDVAASPYDASGYGVSVVPVETLEGRAQYRQEQTVLMERADPIRRDLLAAYDSFLVMAFGECGGETSTQARADPERYAKAEPGGLPWRKNLVKETATQR